jgi:invasion protein IalB
MPVSMRLMAPLILILLALAPASAQQRPPQATVVPQSGPTTGWTKLCSQPGPTSPCVVTQEMYSEQGRFLGSVALQVTPGQPVRRRLVINVPLGMWIEDGIQVRIDNGQIVRTHFGTCLANGCFGAIDVSDAMLAQMRRGRTLQVIVRPPDPQIFHINLPLENFATVFDGQSADPNEVQTRIGAFYRDMQQRAANAPRAQAPGQPAAPRP